MQILKIIFLTTSFVLIGQVSAQAFEKIPQIQFSNGQSINVTNLCLDNQHVRPKGIYNIGHGLRARPVAEVQNFDLGHGRNFTVLRRVQVDSHLIQEFAIRGGVERLVSQHSYDIPECERQLTRKSLDTSEKDLEPTPHQMMVFSSLFQRGITLVETQGYPLLARPYALSAERLGLSQGFFSDKMRATFKTPQCYKGQFELSPEFMRYLKGPEGHQKYQDVVDLLERDPDYANRNFNRVWNNHLNGNHLRYIGGEGSGNGRVGFGIGGEGSGNGRRLEQSSTNPIEIKQAGEVEVQIFMDRRDFLGLSFTPSIVQRLFHKEVQYRKFLLDGEEIPTNLISVECKK